MKKVEIFKMVSKMAAILKQNLVDFLWVFLG